ncbi:MAG: ribonuclease P protein component [Acidimicrobiales bacterium]
MKPVSLKREGFAALRKGAKRYSEGPLSLVCACLSTETSGAESASPPEVGYAINRRTGNAVQRNKLRRRLREIARATQMPQGRYLFVAGPRSCGTSFEELVTTVERLLLRATRKGSGSQCRPAGAVPRWTR